MRPAASTAQRIGEFAFAGALLVFSGLFIWQATLVPEPPRNIIVGPQTVPLILGGLMALTAALLVLRSLRTLLAGTARTGLAVVAEPESDETTIRDWPGVVAVIVALIALFALLEPLGFVVSMTLFLFSLSTLFAPRRWILNLVVAVGFSVFFYWIFTEVLEVTLPAGDLLPAIPGVTG